MGGGPSRQQQLQDRHSCGHGRRQVAQQQGAARWRSSRQERGTSEAAGSKTRHQSGSRQQRCTWPSCKIMPPISWTSKGRSPSTRLLASRTSCGEGSRRAQRRQGGKRSGRQTSHA